MNLTKEIWHDRFQGLIPHDRHYSLRLEHGEENGLILRLESQDNRVILDFGSVHAVNIVDEGVHLNDPPGICTDTLLLLEKTDFSSTLYLVENGGYGTYVKACMTPELYGALHLRQYNVVTMNYCIEIVTAYEPRITVND